MKGNGALLSVLWVSPEDQAQMSAKSYSFKFKGCLALMRLRRGGTIRRELPAQGRYCASGIKTAWYTFCAPSEKRSWNLMKGGNPTLIPLCTVGEECGNEKPSDLTKAMWRVCSRVRSRPKLSAARSGHQNDASFVWLWTQMWAVVCEPCCPCVLIQTHSSPLSVPIKSVFWPQWPEVG